MTKNTGTVDYGRVTDSSKGYDYVTFMEGFDNEVASDVAYYEVPAGSYNRFALQAYWEDVPDNSSAEYYSSDYYLDHTGDLSWYFDRMDPTTDGDDVNGPFYLQVGMGPVSTGSVEFDLIGPDIDYSYDEYNYVDWWIRDEEDVSTSEYDDAPGVRFDINVNSATSYEQWKDITFEGSGTYTIIDYSQDSMPRVPVSTDTMRVTTDFQVDAPDGSE
jgi:hypothetical protein